MVLIDVRVDIECVHGIIVLHIHAHPAIELLITIISHLVLAIVMNENDPKGCAIVNMCVHLNHYSQKDI